MNLPAFKIKPCYTAVDQWVCDSCLTPVDDPTRRPQPDLRCKKCLGVHFITIPHSVVNPGHYEVQWLERVTLGVEAIAQEVVNAFPQPIPNTSLYLDLIRRSIMARLEHLASRRELVKFMGVWSTWPADRPVDA